MGIRAVLVFLMALSPAACHRRPQSGPLDGAWRVACVDANAAHMEVVADYRQWSPLEPLSVEHAGEHWSISIVSPPEGVHRMQCLADGVRYSAPAGAPLVEPDGFGGLNGVFYIRAVTRETGFALKR